MRSIATIAVPLWGFLSLAAPPDQIDPRAEYGFVRDTDRYVMIMRPSGTCVGKLDAAGNFVFDARWINLRGSISSVPPTWLLNSPRGPAYEYRSGRLIRGELNASGDFVPEVGRLVTAFKDYRYGPGAVRIYNLPGRFVRKDAAHGKGAEGPDRRAPGPGKVTGLRAATPAAAVVLSGLACLAPPVARTEPAVEYEFVLELDRYVMMTRGPARSVGKLDAAGNFVPDGRWLNVRGKVSGAPPYALITGRAGPAYEYRSGRLVKGRLDGDGNFVPELGSVVVPLRAYDPGPGAVPIYNLPGRFVKKGQASPKGR
jgi:hypothetical protein